ncbi:cupin domain-containing protein [Burkholderia seminalis]|uniref:cupin domain-containing protein n=1 Tax=Burkholderia seminalis TaxID=488731 RepID=UPI001FC8A07A|nr:cupin domain-containing protein [Burkholderia seminalis]
MGDLVSRAASESRPCFTDGALDVGPYRPRVEDRQTPHTRVEIDVIKTGTSRFVADGRECAVAGGDTLFVPAHAAHRFVGFRRLLDPGVLPRPEGGERARDA